MSILSGCAVRAAVQKLDSIEKQKAFEEFTEAVPEGCNTSEQDIFNAGYQSATERALRIVREENEKTDQWIAHPCDLALAVERRLKADSNG